MNYPKSFIKELYLSAPSEIADVISADETIDSLDQIAQKNSLDASKRAGLERVVTDLMLGLIAKDDLQKELGQVLALSPDLTSKVVEEVGPLISKISPDLLQNQADLAQKKLAELTGNVPSVEETLRSIPEPVAEIETPLAPTVIVEERADLPVVIKREPLIIEKKTIEERKRLLPNINPAPSHYERGQDPYREPV